MCRSDIVFIIIIRPDLSQIYVLLLSPLPGELRGVSKKGVANRMPLEPQLIRSISSSRHPLLFNFTQIWTKNCFSWSFLPTTKQDQALPSRNHEKICPQSTQFWLGVLGSNSILSAHFFRHPVDGRYLSPLLILYKFPNSISKYIRGF